MVRPWDMLQAVYSVDGISVDKVGIKFRALSQCPWEALTVNISSSNPDWQRESNGNKNSHRMASLKLLVRTRYKSRVPNYIHDISFHAGDNEAIHTKHLDWVMRNSSLVVSHATQSIDGAPVEHKLPDANARDLSKPEFRAVLLSYSRDYQQVYQQALQMPDVIALRVYQPTNARAGKTHPISASACLPDRSFSSGPVLLLFTRASGAPLLSNSPGALQPLKSATETRQCMESMGFFDFNECETRVLSGPKVWADPLQLFAALNARGIRYLVSRNYEGFPEQVTLGAHGDIDLMTSDFQATVETMHALPARNPWDMMTAGGIGDARMLTSIRTPNSGTKPAKVFVDVVIPAMDYIDPRWMEAMLERRVQHRLGFYVMQDEDYFYFLLYHVLYQKGGVFAPDYVPRLKNLAKGLGSIPADLVAALSTHRPESKSQLLSTSQAAVRGYLARHGYNVTRRKQTYVSREHG